MASWFSFKFWFSCSFDEVKKLKQCVLRHGNLMTTELQGGLAQWSVYNVVHKVGTLSVKGSSHAMGILFSITSQSGRMPLQTSLLKRENVQNVIEIIKNKWIIINEYLPPSTTGLSTVKFKEMREWKLNKTLSLDCNMDFFCDNSFFL